MRTRRGAPLVLLLALAGCGATRGLVYWPSRSPVEVRPGVEDLTFFSADGTRLHGLLELCPGATRAVLACHGNAGNVDDRKDELDALVAATKAHVLEFDYRGFGRSAGKPEEAGVCADAQAALLALARETGVPHGRTIVFGHSLGGAVAVDLAYRKPAIGGLVVMASFTSLDDLVADLALPLLGWLVPESWDSLAKVPSIAKPKLFIHGTKDGLIPVAHAHELHEAAAEPKELLVVEGAEHDFILGAPGVLPAIARFVDAVAPETSAR